MNSEIMNPTITVGVFAAAAIVMLLASFVHLAKAKGARDAFLWLLFVPMPFTKAMYMFILATIAIHSERPFPSVWLWGAALVFCLVICVQCAIADRRINSERLSGNSTGTESDVPWWFKYFHQRSNIPFVRVEMTFKMFLTCILCGIVETIAIFALVATMIFGQHGMNTTVRTTGRKAGSLAASFVVGVAEGVRDTVSTNKAAAAVAPSNENQSEAAK